MFLLLAHVVSMPIPADNVSGPKSEIPFFSVFQSRTLEQEREIESLESKVGQLETVRQRQANKITGLKSNFEETLNELSSKKSQTQTTIQALSSELKTTKQALDQLTKRERQVCYITLLFI